MRSAVLILILVGLTLIFPQDNPNSSKEVKRALSYQSMIKDSLGNAIEDGKYLISFKLYDSENSEEPVWFENQNVNITDGILNVLLGNKKRLRPELFINPLWLTLDMNGEESEKQYVSASSYSMYSGLVDLNAFAPSEDVSFSLDPDGRIIIGLVNPTPTAIPSIYGDDWNFYTGGSNNWVFHTPDDGRQIMCIINKMHLRPNTDPSNWGPQTIFHENGDFQVNGNIIGTKNLNLSSTLNTNSVNSKFLRFGNIDTTNGYEYLKMTNLAGELVGGFMYNENNLSFQGGSTGKDFVVYAYNDRDLVLKSNKIGGDVYIGAKSCANNLRVTGKIFATEIEVKLDVFPDYVFKKDYNLLSLSEVENHINSYGTLPGMPTEKEIVENGLNINQMQLKLVEKIEELTLHMIRLEKENNELKEMIYSANK
ncbi:MAG: hypothetical protein KKD38_03550 [Candidatus Delongbacteria bacterium]|nr:hypothetical protein [Candidatus Delongbacteria bacterium]MCG2759598.1 hypothetical protein [Candidatus Delongbacteria bacterium]